MTEQYPATLEAKSSIAENTTEVTFRLEKPLVFVPGQYVTVSLIIAGDAASSKERYRDFSIVSAPRDPYHVAIAFRNSESFFKQSLLSGAVNSVEIEGPKGIFLSPEELSDECVFVAGGVGIAPFLSMIRQNATSQSPIVPVVVYGNRSLESAPYFEELEGYAAARTIKLIPIFGAIGQDQLMSVAQEKPRAQWYVAGPPGMVATVRTALTNLNVSEAFIHSEEFSGYA